MKARLLSAVLVVTGFAILAGTQVVYLKDFLSGGDFYRMNTLFKFFSQVWVIWGIAAAIGAARVWDEWVVSEGEKGRKGEREIITAHASRITNHVSSLWRTTWATVFTLLFAASFTFLFFGTPDRLDSRFPNWRPPFGTLNGLDYMNGGEYTWRGRDDLIGQDFPVELRTELRYDREAIDWLLANVRGNPVILESDEIDYYRAGGTRVSTMTGLSSPIGQHKGEQYYGELTGPRDGLLKDLWRQPEFARTLEIMNQLNVALIYIGQLRATRKCDRRYQV